MTTWKVERLNAETGRVEKDYGTFEDRELAERIALAAIEKHPESIVKVTPVQT